MTDRGQGTEDRGQSDGIRAAGVADLARLAPLAEEFYAASAELRKFDLARFVALWTSLLANGTGVIFILERAGAIAGTIGGMVHPEPYSGELLAQEFFWFVAAESRGGGLRLYRTFENWAREKGCAEIRMCHLADSMPDKVATFYERIGFHKTETLYTKRF